MKNNRVNMLILVASLLVFSCGQEQEYFKGLIPPVDPNNIQIKFIHAASDTVGVNLFLDNKKITGNASSTITTSASANGSEVNVGTVAYQGAFPVTNYCAIPNSGTFSIVVPDIYSATIKYPTKTLSSLNASTFLAASYYTVAFVGVTQAYETIYFLDDLSTTPIDGNTYIRFANFIHNSNNKITLKAIPPADPAPAPAPTEVTLLSNVPYKSVTGFIALPKTGTYTNVKIYDAVTNTLIATMPAANSSFTNNKVYTIMAVGQIGGTATKAPAVSRMINR